MNDFLKSLSDKLSAYQLFNFIYPGAVFLGILHFYGMPLGILNEIWWFLLASYFLGMTISRIGSIVIESICLKFKWIEKYDIKKYAMYLKADGFTGILLELTNIYRTICSMGTLLLFVTIFKYEQTDKCCVIFMEISFVLLFGYSFVKQHHYLENKLKD